MRKSFLLRLFGSIWLILLFVFPAAAQAKSPPKKYHIEVRTATFGGSTYLLGFGVCDILNKNSDWVRGSVLESSGTVEGIKVVGNDPKKRKRSAFNCSADQFFKAIKGVPPFDKKAEIYKNVKILIFQQYLAGMFVTLNPDIKTLADLKGKKVATWPKGSAKFEHSYNLAAGAGKEVLDSIKWQFTDYAGYDDMIVGKTDAALTYCGYAGKGRFGPMPKLRELMSKRRVYFVTATSEMRRKSRELFGDAYGATLKLPANTFESNLPRQDILCFMPVVAWGVYPDVPDNVVYEIVKTLDENHTMFKDYHSAGRNIDPTTYGLYPAGKEYFHPGARKYFDEKGIEYGRDYFFKVFAD